MPCVYAKRSSCDWRSGASLRNAEFSPPHGWARVPQSPLPAVPLPIGFPRTKRPPTGNTALPSMSTPAAAASIVASWYAVCFCIQVTASAERQRHGKRQLAIGRQVPSESGMASAEGAARQVRERSGKHQVAEAQQAPSEFSTASAERERHGKRRGGVAQQAQSGRGRNRY